MNITFIGIGYVGLVSSVMLSYLGHNVSCLDTDRNKIANLKKGILPIYEPGLDKYLSYCLARGRLKFLENYNEHIQTSTAIFITVGTPTLPSQRADLQYVFDAVDNIVKLDSSPTIIIKSTVPPGTTDFIAHYIAKKKLLSKVASNPEFLREGTAVEDFLRPDRIVIGTSDKETSDLLKEIYAPLLAEGIHLISTDPTTSELIKYASNAFLATKIAFINEMANLCEEIEANIDHLSLGMGLDKRIGNSFLKAGPGFGGSCFPKDILALSQLAKDHHSDSLVLDAVINANQKRPLDMVKRIKSILDGSLSGKTIAVLGLAFKAGTDDLRSSPAIEIIKLLQDEGANIKAYDPAGMKNIEQVLTIDRLECTSSPEKSCYEVDAIIIATEWEEFKELEWDKIYNNSKSHIIIDLRNILNSSVIKAKGFKYYSIGHKYEA